LGRYFVEGGSYFSQTNPTPAKTIKMKTKMNVGQIWVLLGIITILAGIALNVMAMQKFGELNSFVDQCNQYYNKQFEQACVPQQPYQMGWSPQNWTINLSTSTLTPS